MLVTMTHLKLLLDGCLCTSLGSGLNGLIDGFSRRTCTPYMSLRQGFAEIAALADSLHTRKRFADEGHAPNAGDQ